MNMSMWEALETEPEQIAETSGGLRAGRLLAVRQYLAAHFHEPRCSARVAAEFLGISERYVHDLMTGQGESFSDAVNRLRLEMVARRLIDPDYAGRRIGEIAFAVGFSDISYFNRLFRRRFGMTPRVYRARNAVRDQG